MGAACVKSAAKDILKADLENESHSLTSRSQAWEAKSNTPQQTASSPTAWKLHKKMYVGIFFNMPNLTCSIRTIDFYI